MNSAIPLYPGMNINFTYNEYMWNILSVIGAFQNFEGLTAQVKK